MYLTNFRTPEVECRYVKMSKKLSKITLIPKAAKYESSRRLSLNKHVSPQYAKRLRAMQLN